MTKSDKTKEFKKRIYGYVIRLIKLLKKFPKDTVTKEIVRQLIRSGTSIGANYFEATSASTKKDFINYFNHSLKSSKESVFWFNVLIDSGLVPINMKEECRWLLKETQELAKIFASSILTMKKSLK